MAGIFPDDAPADARRETAVTRLLSLCPPAYRLTMRPLAEAAMANASDAEINALMVDIERVPAMAEAGDMDGIAALAKRYGATDETIGAYLPMFTGGSHVERGP